MEKNDILNNFIILYTDAISSEDEDDNKISLSMFRVAMHRLIEIDPEYAKNIVERYEGLLKYYNFLTEKEAKEIVSKFENSDGSKGPRWSFEDVFREIAHTNNVLEDEPYYNKWALCVTINMYASDHINAMKKWVGDNESKIFELCYDMARGTLRDDDRPYWIRKYFDLAL